MPALSRIRAGVASATTRSPNHQTNRAYGIGESGFRSRCLVLAKHALFRLSQSPIFVMNFLMGSNSLCLSAYSQRNFQWVQIPPQPIWRQVLFFNFYFCSKSVGNHTFSYKKLIFIHFFKKKTKKWDFVEISIFKKTISTKMEFKNE